jgi:hypothetical protein
METSGATTVSLYDLATSKVVARHTVEGMRVAHACNSSGYVAILFISGIGTSRHAAVQVFQQGHKSHPRHMQTLEALSSERAERTGFVFISEALSTGTTVRVMVGYRQSVWALEVDKSGFVLLREVLLDHSNVSSAQIAAMDWRWEFGGLVGLSDGTLLRVGVSNEVSYAEQKHEIPVSAVAVSPSGQDLWCVLADGTLLLKHERAASKRERFLPGNLEDEERASDSAAKPTSEPWFCPLHLGQSVLRFEWLGSELFAVCGLGLVHLSEACNEVSYLCMPGGVAGLWLDRDGASTLVCASQLGKLTTWNWLTGELRHWSARSAPLRQLQSGVSKERYFVLLPSGMLETGPVPPSRAESAEVLDAALLCQRLVRGKQVSLFFL